jgi:uncharacterized protein (TIGR02145 family)
MILYDIQLNNQIKLQLNLENKINFDNLNLWFYRMRKFIFIINIGKQTMQKLIMILSILGMLFIASCSSDKGTETVSTAPRIESIAPDKATVGDFITISGTNFGEYTNKSYVLFNGMKSVIYDNWSNTLIRAQIPFGATSGNVVVEVNTELSNGINIEIDPYYDLDGFETVIIGNQIWKQKNLDVSHYRNGDPIFQAQTDKEWQQAGEQGIGAWCYYNNDPENGKVYGKLYNWYAVNDPRGLAPEGWRIASDEDWKGLKENLVFVAGSKLAGGYDLWINGALRNHSEFITSGFFGHPGGYCNRNGYFEYINAGSFWWTSTEWQPVPATAIYYYIRHNDTYIASADNFKSLGLSVRCVRD